MLDAEDPRQDTGFKSVSAELADVDLDRVVAGDQRAIHAYVEGWRSARSLLLAQVARDCPTVTLPPLTAEALDWEALQAPFTVWRHVGDAHDGLALALIARLRSMLVHVAKPLLPGDLAGHPEVTGPVGGRGAQRFYRHALAAMERRGTLAAQIVDAFDLSKAELGRLFGVSRQAAADWLESDIPRDRRAKAVAVLAIADLLAHRLKPGRLPGVARRPGPAYGGLSMLEMVAADRHEELLDSVRASFDFARTA